MVKEGRRGKQIGSQILTAIPPIYIDPLVFRNEIDSAGAGINDSDRRVDDEDHGDE